MNLRWKIGGGMALIAAIVSIAGSLAAYTSTDAELTQSVDNSLMDSAARVLNIPVDRIDEDDNDNDNENEDENENDDNENENGNQQQNGGNPRPIRQSDLCPLALLQPTDAAQLIYPDGSIEPCFTDSPALPIDANDLAVATNGDGDLDDIHLHTVSVDGTDYRVITVAWFNNGALQSARDLHSVDEVLGGVRIRLFLAGIFATLGAWILGWIIAGRIARPIRELSSVAAEVATSRDLTIEVPVHGTGEVSDLGRSFSSMMNALSTSLEQQQRLVSDASHELRTPLTALRTNIESLELFDAIPEAERREMIRDIRLEVEELSTLTAELVDLATDQVQNAEQIGTVDLLALTRDVAQRARRRSGRTIDVTDGGGNAIDGFSHQLLRAVSNLVDNAIKYSPAGSSIEITVDGGSVRVRDHGPGIAPQDLPHIFERFYRSINARTAPGSGLGLAIVADAVSRHQGTVFAANAPDGGVIVGFDLPEP
jgi:two-component system sensor histidine kinase MprB